MSSKIGSANHGRAAVPIPWLVRAAIYAVAWLPFLGLILVFVPRFEPLFRKLDVRGELPALTESILWLSRVNETLG